MQVTTRGVASGVTVMALLVWGVIALPGPEHRGALDVTGTWSLSIKLENYASGSAVFRQDGETLTGTYTGPPGIRTTSGGWAYASRLDAGGMGVLRPRVSLDT